jgi:pyruvate-formate lyase
MAQQAVGASWTGLNQEEPNSRLLVEFFLEAVEKPLEWDEHGQSAPPDGLKHYQEKEMEFIRIMVPGDRDNIVVRPVQERDRRQFAQAYAAFKNKVQQPEQGTLLSAVPFLTKPQILEFQSMNIRTAEQLRDCSDSIGQGIMGIHALKRRITDYLEQKAGAEPALKLRAELEKRDEEIKATKEMTDSLKKTLEEQQKRIEELTRRK